MEREYWGEVLSYNFEEKKVLSSLDVAPLEIVNGAGQASVVLTCEHAGRRIPVCLGDLGVDPQEMERHIAYDIGAQALSRLLAHKLDAPLFIQPYSRLVIDCNRPFSSPTLIPSVSDGTLIPANQAITLAQRQARFDEIHQVFHNSIRQFMCQKRQAGHSLALVSIHSFTRQLRTSGKPRQLSLGLLFNRDRRLADLLLTEIQAQFPDIKVALNQPYSIGDAGDYTIPQHGEVGGVPHVLIEIVNDEIDDAAGQARWCDILVTVFKSINRV